MTQNNTIMKDFNKKRFFGLMIAVVIIGGLITLTGIPIVENWSWGEFFMIELILAVVPIPVYFICSFPKEYWEEFGK